jgi:hypothetical protein
MIKKLAKGQAKSRIHLEKLNQMFPIHLKLPQFEGKKAKLDGVRLVTYFWSETNGTLIAPYLPF